ncbi:MAG: hypothetical protein LBK13_07930 [Spirochaetales bacterium]|nr:hypothetical protein [Spirochaetales bacterium]
MKKISVLGMMCVFCLLCGVCLYAQTDSSPEAGVEPFVSRLKVAVKGSQIKLAWQDSRDASARYAIYRHTAEITPENFRAATFVASVPRGEETYIDAPSLPGEYFYAVLSFTSDGKPHEVFIPFRNKTTAGIVIEQTMTEAGLAARISAIRAVAEEKNIRITFTASRADRELMLFRSTSPILYPSQLLSTREARRIKSSETGIPDYPVAGIPYYYALIDAELLDSGNSESVKLEPEGNTTVQPAEIPLSKDSLALEIKPEAEGRSIPLPYFILDSGISAEGTLRLPASASIPDYRALSPTAHRAVQDVLRHTGSPAATRMPLPALLEQDRTRGFGREDYTLQTVLHSAFAEKNWKETERLLNHYLEMPITASARGRAHFYRGQALFFQQRYEESFMDFLMTLDGHYSAAQPWISGILETMKTRALQAGG